MPLRLSTCARLTLFAPLVACLWTSTASAQSGTPSPSTTPSATADAADRPIATCDRFGFATIFFRCLPHDLTGIVHADALRTLGVGGALTGGSFLLDDDVTRKFGEPREGTTVAVGRYLGEASVQFGAPAAAYFIARAMGNDGAEQLSIMIVRTQMVNAVLTRGLKFIPRARPYEQTADPGQGSFPSGHASASFATATVFQRKWGWKAGVPAYLVASFIGATRLANAHHLSDVTFGAAVGIASGLAIDLPGRHPALSPIIAPGTVGLSITIGQPRS
jgi:PAP2 superfamily protein